MAYPALSQPGRRPSPMGTFPPPALRTRRADFRHRALSSGIMRLAHGLPGHDQHDAQYLASSTDRSGVSRGVLQLRRRLRRCPLAPGGAWVNRTTTPTRGHPAVRRLAITRPRATSPPAAYGRPRRWQVVVGARRPRRDGRVCRPSVARDGWVVDSRAAPAVGNRDRRHGRSPRLLDTGRWPADRRTYTGRFGVDAGPTASTSHRLTVAGT